MKLIKTKEQVREVVSFDGMLNGVITHEIKSSAGELSYCGPKINPDKWREVMAFFHWVNEEYKSEAQVRIFFDPVEKEYLFWAFPQEAGGGLSTKEIAGQEASRQRASLPFSQRLIQAGTVHSHCNVSAFQSGTDERDERLVTGLHVTIGHLDKSVFDFHARFYVKQGCCFEPDISNFWDIGSVKEALPPNIHNEVARFQMCKKPVDLSFPQIWKDNLIEKKKEVVSFRGVGIGDWGPGAYDLTPTSTQAMQCALFDLRRELHPYGMGDDEVRALLERVVGDPVVMEVISICVEHQCNPEDLLEDLGEKNENPNREIQDYM